MPKGGRRAKGKGKGLAMAAAVGKRMADVTCFPATLLMLFLFASCIFRASLTCDVCVTFALSNRAYANVTHFLVARQHSHNLCDSFYSQQIVALDVSSNLLLQLCFLLSKEAKRNLQNAEKLSTELKATWVATTIRTSITSASFR